MNDEFALEMKKYNTVFKRLEDENRYLRKYADVETAELLEELEAEIEILREEKRRDQMAIGDIERRLAAISHSRTDRTAELYRNYTETAPYYPPSHRTRHFFSPSYPPPSSSRYTHSPPPLHEEARIATRHYPHQRPGYHPSPIASRHLQQPEVSKSRARLSRNK